MLRNSGQTFFTADTHFGHAGARALYRRPFADVDEMDRALVAAWQDRVGPDDTVWHLGDFAVRHPDPAGLLAELPGTKHLVFGNNDPAPIRSLPGWASVVGLAELVADDVPLILCHYALRTWPGQAKGALNLHGHSHGRLKPIPGQFDVGVDAQNFRPVTLAEILSSR
ncbi:MAG: metallophosphoesterase [Acetobacteraceae bacterium]|nr:metallophosphoesterase [Acetobacteraceae bacterium]